MRSRTARASAAGHSARPRHSGPRRSVAGSLLLPSREPAEPGSALVGLPAEPSQGWFRDGFLAPSRPCERTALPPTTSPRRRAAHARASVPEAPALESFPLSSPLPAPGTPRDPPLLSLTL